MPSRSLRKNLPAFAIRCATIASRWQRLAFLISRLKVRFLRGAPTRARTVRGHRRPLVDPGPGDSRSAAEALRAGTDLDIHIEPGCDGLPLVAPGTVCPLPYAVVGARDHEAVAVERSSGQHGSFLRDENPHERDQPHP